MLRLGEAAMINALRRVSVQRGHDPRDFVLVAGGGGGPMHAASLGQELGVREVIVPRHPGHSSAWGMLVTQPRRDFLQTALQPATAMTPRTLASIFAALEREARAYFDADAQMRGRLAFEHAVDLRYHGQEHWITVRIELARAAIADIVESFHEAHERAYTFQLADTPVEFVNFRLTAIVPLEVPRFMAIEPAGRSVQAAARGERMVHFGEHGRRKARIFRRESIPPDIDIAGPVVIEEPSSTTVVLPHQRVFVDRFGFLHIGAAGRGKPGMAGRLELAGL
jgi:N-methylhydantoinase A